MLICLHFMYFATIVLFGRGNNSSLRISQTCNKSMITVSYKVGSSTPGPERELYS